MAQGDGTPDADSLSADFSAVEAAWAEPIAMAATAPQDVEGEGGRSFPVGSGPGPNTGTTIPAFDPSHPLASIGARLKWRWQNSDWYGSVSMTSPEHAPPDDSVDPGASNPANSTDPGEPDPGYVNPGYSPDDPNPDESTDPGEPIPMEPDPGHSPDDLNPDESTDPGDSNSDSGASSPDETDPEYSS